MAEQNKIQTTDPRAAKKKRVAIILVSLCIIAVVGMFFLDSGTFTFNFGEFNSSEDKNAIPMTELWSPDWETNIFELPEYLEKDRYLTYAESGMSVAITDGDYASYGAPIQFFADYFDALMRGDAQAVCSFYADSYFENRDRWERLTMQKIYDMRVEFISAADATVDGRTVTNRHYKVTYKIMENDGLFRNDVLSDAERAQYYVITDFGSEMLITDVGYSFLG